MRQVEEGSISRSRISILTSALSVFFFRLFPSGGSARTTPPLLSSTGAHLSHPASPSREGTQVSEYGSDVARSAVRACRLRLHIFGRSACAIVLDTPFAYCTQCLHVEDTSDRGRAAWSMICSRHGSIGMPMLGGPCTGQSPLPLCVSRGKRRSDGLIEDESLNDERGAEAQVQRRRGVVGGVLVLVPAYHF